MGFFHLDRDFFCMKSSYFPGILLRNSKMVVTDEKIITEAWHHLFHHIILYRNIYDVFFTHLIDKFKS